MWRSFTMEAKQALESGNPQWAYTILVRDLDKGDPEAFYLLSRMYAKGQGTPKDLAKSLQACREAAKRGFTPALREMGLKYQFGEGVPVDFAEARSWYLKGAEYGDAASMDCLGAMCYAGLGVEKDFVEAARWFRKAADAMGGGSWALGRMYERGQGVEKDLVEAYVLYSKASSIQPIGSELERIDRLEREMTPEQRAEAKRRLSDQ